MPLTTPALQPGAWGFPDLDKVLAELASGERTWATLTPRERAKMLGTVHALAVRHAGAWVEAACRAKQLPADSPLAGEEWLSGPYPIATNAATLARSLQRLARGVSPVEDHNVGTAPGGRVAVDVFPVTAWDRLLLSGYSAQVWQTPGVTAKSVRDTAGLAQRDPSRTGGIGLVLGAGNVTSIAVLDTLYELIANNRVVILKLNPVMDAMYDVTCAVLAPLLEAGVVRVVTGGADVGSYLVHHPRVDHVHITGSSASHDAIVFGAGEEGLRRKAAGDVQLDKPITSELGGVSPTIVVPEGWSGRDIRYQAQHVATQRLHNGGYNCVASQVVVIPAEWKDKTAFLQALRDEIDGAPDRIAYYPGSADRVAAALEDHPGAAEICAHRRVLIRGLLPDSDAAVFRTEYFSPVLAVVELPGRGKAYLDAVARFVNDRLAGTLGANVLVHPRLLKALDGEFDEFLSSLHYGTIAVNAWPAFGYLTAAAPWGAFPGATPDDVQSGVGVVHNALLLANTERTLVRGPFRPFPRSVLTGQWSISRSLPGSCGIARPTRPDVSS